MADQILIIGAGQAGAQAIQSLRAEGVTAPITLVGEEPQLPYQRPPLSKKFLSGELEEERLYLRPAAYYAENAVALRLGRRATALDRATRTVTLDDGTVLAYSQVLLATGARPRLPPVPCEGLAGVHLLRTIADVAAIRRDLAPGARVVIVGGGYIGLEVAAVLVTRGHAVTVIEMAPRVMARQAAPEISAFFAAEHRKAGVDLVLDAPVTAIEAAAGRAAGVVAGGVRHPADLVIVGVGVVPNVELAASSGLACADGIVVDACGRTNDPAVFAAGDCTHHFFAAAEMHLRLESVQNAIDQAKAAASAMAGRPKPYLETPWFWSDQYDLKLQIAGIAKPGDLRVLRGTPAARKFAVFHLRAGRVAAVESVNAAPEFMVGRTLIARRAEIAPERLADIDIPMKSLA